MTSPRVVIAKCKLCGKVKSFQGVNIIDLINIIDNSGWRDKPDIKAGNLLWLCSECDKKENQREERSLS